MTLFQPQLPIEPGNSEWSLRFSHRHHHWRHRSEKDGFRREEFEVSELATDTEARLFIETHHYSGSYVAAIKRYGLYWHGMLVGVLVLSSPMNNRVLTNVFPDLVPGHESVELGRLCLKEEAPYNSESYFVARVWELATTAGIRGVVSFSDPVPRLSADGTLLFAGHVGWIYQSCNFLKSGRSTPRTQLLFPDGSIFNDRLRQKIRAQEDGAETGEKLLVRWGARPRRTGESPATWLQEQLSVLPLRRVYHPGMHRYISTLGPGRKRHLVRVAAVGEPYPKAPDPIPQYK
jgi:hypothetical protein